MPVVELAGLPGSGKSALAKELVRRLGRAGVPCTIADAGISARASTRARMVRRAGYALCQAVSEPGASRRATSVLLSSRQETGRDVAAVLAQWLATCRLVSSGRRASGVQLLEEGLVQTAWTALLRSRRLCPADLWSCTPPASRADLVLLLDVPPDLAAARLVRRRSRHSRVQQLPLTAMTTELHRGQAVLEDLLLTCPLPVVRMPAAGRSRVELADAAAETLPAPMGGLAHGGPDLH